MTDPPEKLLGPGLTWGIGVAASAGLVLSGVLTVAAMDPTLGPPGCGGGSGCGDVLGSRWAKLRGVPVGAFAAWVYMLVLIGLWRTREGRGRRMLGFASVCLLGAAAWFVGLQMVELDALCPYCMAAHALGVATGVMIILGKLVAWRGAVAGGIASVTLMAVQLTTPPPPPEEVLAANETDTDVQEVETRVISLFDGGLTLDLSEEPLIGNPDAQDIVVIFSDYGCPHCRTTHQMLKLLIDRDPQRLAVVSLPVSLNPDCAGRIQSAHPNFAESCELATLSIAASRLDGQAWTSLDQWIFGAGASVTYAAALEYARTLFPTEALDAEIADEDVRTTLERNVRFAGETGASQVPILASPGRSTRAGAASAVDILDWLEEGVRP